MGAKCPQSSVILSAGAGMAAQLNAKRIAVCMSGSARTLVHPIVLQTHRKHLLQPLDADLFAVVNIDVRTQHSRLSQHPQSELARRGGERWRVSQALQLLGALETVFQEDNPEPVGLRACPRSHFDGTGRSMLWGIQLCGELVRAHEENRGLVYEWIVRVRPDTFFRQPIRRPPTALPEESFLCHNNDAFFLARPRAAPALFSVWSLALGPDCRLVGNTSLTRSFRKDMRCGFDRSVIYLDCLFRVAASFHRLYDAGSKRCDRVVGNKGRDFFRAYHCSQPPCTTANWSSRNAAVFFPMSPNEKLTDHGNLTLDRDIHEWAVATGALLPI